MHSPSSTTSFSYWQKKCHTKTRIENLYGKTLNIFLHAKYDPTQMTPRAFSANNRQLIILLILCNLTS